MRKKTTISHTNKPTNDPVQCHGGCDDKIILITIVLAITVSSLTTSIVVIIITIMITITITIASHD